MAPLLLLDVDGVLNALPLRRDPMQPGWRRGKAVAQGHAFPMRYNPAIGRKLVELALETGAELTWLTTWEHDANTQIAPLVGLPTGLPVVDLAPGRSGMKFSEVRSPGQVKALSLRVYAPERDWLWLDDDATANDLHTASQGLPEAERALLQVHGRYGLQDKHLERARKWLLRLQARA